MSENFICFIEYFVLLCLLFASYYNSAFNLRNENCICFVLQSSFFIPRLSFIKLALRTLPLGTFHSLLATRYLLLVTFHSLLKTHHSLRMFNINSVGSILEKITWVKIRIFLFIQLYISCIRRHRGLKYFLLFRELLHL